MDNDDTPPNVFQLPTVAVATSSSTSTSTAVVSLKDEYFNKLDTFIESSGALGSLLVVGIEKEDDDEENEDDDEENDDNEDYTAAQLETLRFIIINANRSKCLEKAEKFAGVATNYYYCHCCYHHYHSLYI